MALLVVKERNEIFKTGYQIAKLQGEFLELSERNRKLYYHVQQLKLPKTIASKVRYLKLPVMPRDKRPEEIVIRETGINEGTEKTVKTAFKSNLCMRNNTAFNCCTFSN